MRWRTWLLVTLLPPALALPATLADGAARQPAKGGKITWKKTVVDPSFRSEGVAVADVNKDGKLDILAGDVWYEAPAWKMHVIRKDRKFNPQVYSESFGCFADDFNGDGWPDLIVLPFPGKAIYWYENPKGKSGPWKEHQLWHSCCNETPQFADLFGTGQRVLIMGWQPLAKKVKGKDGKVTLQPTDNQGQMAWFRPGKDPTKPWEMHPISPPSVPGKPPVPGTFRFSHGLGVGDMNRDGRLDVICTGGWWEQPAKDDGKPWQFHPANLGEAAADMFAYDVDGDGKMDAISSSAHKYGLWWHQQRGPDGKDAFVRGDLFPMPKAWAVPAKGIQLSREEDALRLALNKYRESKNTAPLKVDATLSKLARQLAQGGNADSKQADALAAKAGYKGKVHVLAQKTAGGAAAEAAKELATRIPDPLNRWTEVGIAVGKDGKGEPAVVLVLGKGDRFYLMSETHAMHCVDLDGDGLKDLVTGRRWWSHGSRGEPGSADPAFLYWFKARRGPDGMIRFTPIRIDDDSGVGTQFVMPDLNGDGLLDIVISNKKGVFVFEQVRTKE